MKRKIIQINEEKCTGCGLCVNVCAEAALEIIDGKARLTKDFYCDGMGACLDVCPTNALKTVEEEAHTYNPEKTYQHVKQVRGKEAAQKIHGIHKIKQTEQSGQPMACGCPGSMMRDFRNSQPSLNQTNQSGIANQKSELKQWPIQLRLLMPQAPYFKDADLLIVADCVPFAYAGFHQRFLKNKILIMFCPKLDHQLDEYQEKLTEIFKTQNIQSITILHMEVPCCGGIEHIVKQALDKSEKNIVIKEYTISLHGEIV